MVQYSEMLKSARAQAGLTQLELSRLVGCWTTEISTFEAGRRRPSLARLEALLKACGFELTAKPIGGQRG